MVLVKIASTVTIATASMRVEREPNSGTGVGSILIVTILSTDRLIMVGLPFWPGPVAVIKGVNVCAVL